MGDMVLHDNGLVNNGIDVMDGKWWWPLFANSMDSALIHCRK